MNFIRTLAALLTVALSSGCSIMHPVADDYGSYLKNNEGASHFPTSQVADQYALTAKTQDHHYEFRAATVGYAHVWVVEFGKILDTTMRSKDVVAALGTVSKAADTGPVGASTLVFELQDYTFKEFGAHIDLTISVKNAQA